MKTADPRVRRAAALLCCAALVGMGSCGLEGDGPYREAGVRLPEPIPKAAFTLTATDGRRFEFLRETRDRVALLFFGYTHCPDVCPVHMANLAAALERLPLAISAAVTVVFVTTDPERDTTERLRTWLDQFSSDFVGLTGSEDELERIQLAYRVAPAVREAGDDGGYSVSHAAHILAFTRDDSAHVVFPFGTRQSDWVRELPRLVERR